MSPLSRPLRQPLASSELAAALASCRRAFLAIALFSGMSNLLMLTGALFMLEIYDRVLPSRSVPTLVALLILVAGLYAAQGVIDAIRSRILVRVGHSLDEAMSMRVYDAIVRLPFKIGGKGDGTQPIRDLDTVRGFLSGAGPVALFDLPWMPIYLAICFLFHTYIGLTALAGAIVLVTLTVMTEVLTRRPTRSATQFAMARNALMEASRRNAEAITAMGMVGRIAQRWGGLNRSYVLSSGRASDVAGGLGAMSKVLRLLLQSAILAVGAWLVIHGQSTPGIIIAGSILGARALAPVDLAIANWRGFVAARQGWQRLSRLLGYLRLFSGMSNLLMLTGALFMLEIYDRVLPSRSVPTLVALLILAAGLYAAQGVIDAIRSRILVRVGHSLDEAMSMRVYDAIVRLAAQDWRQGRGHAADPRSRYRARVSVRRRAGRPVRSAVDADLPRHLFPVPYLYRPHRARRRDRPGHAHRHDRSADPAADPQRHAICHGAQRADGGEPPQRRSDHGHGHGRPHRAALGRS